MTREQLQRRLKELKAELEDIYSMSEERACDLYHVDEKSEAITVIEEEIERLQKKLDETDNGDEEEQRMYHFAFPTESAFWRWKGC